MSMISADKKINDTESKTIVKDKKKQGSRRNDENSNVTQLKLISN